LASIELTRATYFVAFSSNRCYHFQKFAFFANARLVGDLPGEKNSNLLGGFVLTALLLSNDFAQTAKTSPIKPKTSDEIQTTRPAKTVTTEKIGLDVAEALTLIEDNHVGGKKLDYNELFKSSITSMLHTLDPHSNYFDAKEFEQFRTEQSSRYFGIGASIGSLSDKNGKVIATYIARLSRARPPTAPVFVTAIKSSKSTAFRCSANRRRKSAAICADRAAPSPRSPSSGTARASAKPSKSSATPFRSPRLPKRIWFARRRLHCDDRQF
jgi:hypothetical protein